MTNKIVKDEQINIILPAKNEEASLSTLLPKLVNHYDSQLITVVNDGSKDSTKKVCGKYGVKIINHPYSKGNGAAIKSGARLSNANYIVFMDADGQHEPRNVQQLIEELENGYDMVIGARSSKSQAGILRGLGNRFYNWFAGLMTGQEILDLTSGFRAVDAEKFKEFLHLYPNGFSYPTTSTMAFYRSGYSVKFIPIEAEKRIGNSHLKIFKDGARFFLIIFKIGTLYSPLKIFVPISFANFLLGVSYYGYTFFTAGRFTNMGVLFFISSLLIFLIGLVSEQITNLVYQNNSKD